MAKKKNTKYPHLLSPENYIRQKGRALPIYECYVNSDWEDSKIANVCVSRKHSNGNVTACVYLVDLYCLGVKDTGYFFNTSMDDFNRLTMKIVENQGELVSYTQVHNIIYAGLEFASEYGFQPHKEFNAVTRHFLEEDTDVIELIDIECGMDGKPAAFRGPHDTDLRFMNIVKRLELTAGKGNFYIFDVKDINDDAEASDYNDEEDEEFIDDSVENNEEDIALSDEFDNFSREEKVSLFKSMKEDFPESMKGNELSRFLKLTDSIFDEIIHKSNYGEAYDNLTDELNIDIELDTIPDQFFTNDGTLVPEDFKEHYLLVYNTAFDDLREAKLEFKLFDKFTRKQPYCAYLELMIHNLDESREYPSLLNEYAKEFPDYPPIRLLWLDERVRSGSKPEEFPEYPFRLGNFFPGRTSLHESEIRDYLNLLLSTWRINKDYSRLTALEHAITISEIPHTVAVTIIATISMIKVTRMLELVQSGDLLA